MYILGINGSPREGGNTDLLLEETLNGARGKGAKTEKVILNRLHMAPCQECKNVRDDGRCKIDDDFQPLYDKILKSGALILATPIFFGSLSAQTKIMIDRFQCHWRYKYILKKDSVREKIPGAFIAVEASDRTDFFDNAKAITKNFFSTINVKYEFELLCSGVDSKGAITKRPDCLKRASSLGRNLAA